MGRLIITAAIVGAAFLAIGWDELKSVEVCNGTAQQCQKL